MKRMVIIKTSINQKSPGRIGHPGDFPIERLYYFFVGQMYNLCFGQVTNLLRSASATASARLETASLERI